MRNLTDITVIQAILLGIIGAIAIISWILSTFFSMRALIVAAMVGIVLGHTKDALIFGAAAELLYLGLINAAGVVPPNPVGPGIFGTILYLQGQNLGTAIVASMPFAIFIQFMITVIFTAMSPAGKIGENLIKKEKFRAYKWLSQGTVILLGVLGMVVGLAAGLGAKGFGTLIAKIPVWLQNGLGVGGKMLPAMGFAVVLRLMLKREYIPFLLVGFALVIIFTAVGISKPEWGFNLVAIAITATAIALVVYFSGSLTRSDGKPKRKELEEETDGI